MDQNFRIWWKAGESERFLVPVSDPEDGFRILSILTNFYTRFQKTSTRIEKGLEYYDKDSDLWDEWSIDMQEKRTEKTNEKFDKLIQLLSR